MAGNFLRISICLFCFVLLVSSRRLRAKDKTEQEEDEDAAAFMMELVDNLKHMMKNGIKAAKIPPLDPLLMDEDTNIEFGKGTSKFNIFIAKGFRIDGLTDFDVTDLQVKTRKMYVNATVVVPKVVAEGRYQLDGKVLFVPLTGDGDFYARVEDVDAHFVVNLREVDGHYQTESFDLDFQWRLLKVNLENIVDPNLSPVINKIINGMATKFYLRFKPIIMRIMNESLPAIFNNILSKYTIEEIKSGKFIQLRR